MGDCFGLQTQKGSIFRACEALAYLELLVMLPWVERLNIDDRTLEAMPDSAIETVRLTALWSFSAKTQDTRLLNVTDWGSLYMVGNLLVMVSHGRAACAVPYRAACLSSSVQGAAC
jgi:hypothetical protein